MKKVVITFFTIIILMLSSCGQTSPSTQAANSSIKSDVLTSNYSISEKSDSSNTTSEISQIDDTEIAFDVSFDAQISESSEDGYPCFIVNTNLPDTTIIRVTVDGANNYSETKEMPVVDGVAISEPFDDNGYELENGNYEARIETVDATKQPTEVQEVIGDGGCNLTGDSIENVGIDQANLHAVAQLTFNVDIPPAIWTEDVSFSMAIDESSSDVKWIFNIETNLPSNMELSFVLSNHNSGDDYYIEYNHVYLDHGNASVEFVPGAFNTDDLFNSKRNQTVMPNGEYLVQIDTNFYKKFSDEVLQIIGDTGEHLTGPFIKEGNDGRYLAVRMVFSYYDGAFYDLHYETTEEYANLMGLDVGDNGELVYPTEDESKALRRAKQYLDVLPFSYSSLVEQLEYEGFTHDDAVYGVDHCEANWYEQAVKKGQAHLNLFNYSESELIDQLEYEGFTHDEAKYAATQLGI